MKIVINPEYGGFSPNYKVIMRYGEIKGITLYPYVHSFGPRGGSIYTPYTGEPLKTWFEEMSIHYFTRPLSKSGRLTTSASKSYFSGLDFARDDPALVQAVEEAGIYSTELKVVEIPDDVEWEIEEYDGAEWVSEKHRTWS